jgi:translation initiation factor 4G
LDPPEDFSVPEGCAWTSDPTRVAQIEEMSATKRQGGEVSKVGGKSHANNVNTTAPPLEECAPLQVNEETRWKAKIFTAEQVAAAAAANSFSAEDMFAKALLVLNKLSWTTMDKLSQELMNLYWEVPFNSVDHEVQSNNTNAVEVLRGIIRLIVQKAQAEPHFAGMYAQLCATLHKIYSTKTKEGNRNVEGSSTSPTQQPQSQRFLKKLLLEECQEAFHQDSMQRLQEITQNMTEPDEIAYHANLIRKHYVGLMRFLGELYCRDMIKIDIMIWCLKHLLQLEKADELSTEDSPAPHNHDVSQRTVQETSTAENLALQQVDNNSNDNDGAKTSSSTKSRDEIEVEEEKLECFAKLITTIGSMLEQQALGLRQSGKPKSSLELQDCWEYVYLLAGRKLPARLEPRGDEANGGNIKKQPISPNAKVSNRLKFMLQDLIEMKENGKRFDRNNFLPRLLAPDSLVGSLTIIVAFQAGSLVVLSIRLKQYPSFIKMWQTKLLLPNSKQDGLPPRGIYVLPWPRRLLAQWRGVQVTGVGSI